MVYIFFGIKSARALAKLTRRSQVRNSSLFIHYLFIYLFIFLKPCKTPVSSFEFRSSWREQGTRENAGRGEGGRAGLGARPPPQKMPFMNALKLLLSLLRFRVSRVRKKGFCVALVAVCCGDFTKICSRSEFCRK
jgi:hypothetical protein